MVCGSRRLHSKFQETRKWTPCFLHSDRSYFQYNLLIILYVESRIYAVCCEKVGNSNMLESKFSSACKPNQHNRPPMGFSIYSIKHSSTSTLPIKFSFCSVLSLLFSWVKIRYPRSRYPVYF